MLLNNGSSAASIRPTHSSKTNWSASTLQKGSRPPGEHGTRRGTLLDRRDQARAASHPSLAGGALPNGQRLPASDRRPAASVYAGGGAFSLSPVASAPGRRPSVPTALGPVPAEPVLVDHGGLR